MDGTILWRLSCCNSLPILNPSTTPTLLSRLAEALAASESQVSAAVELLDGGATVPFISRYRKEVTGGLTDTQLRLLEERLAYLREFDARREAIVMSIEEQGKLDDALRARLQGATTKAELEDLYLPFKKKRRTKGQIAIEAGLEPLATGLWDNPQHDPETFAQDFVDNERGVEDTKAALDGAQAILMEAFAERADLVGKLRERLTSDGYVCAAVMSGKESEGAKFSDYFDHQEPLAKMPGHRILAMFRGRSEGVLSLKVKLREADGYGDEACINMIAADVGFRDENRPADAWRARVVSWTWKVKLATRLETELFLALREKADAEAISVFAANLRDLLLAAPAGHRPTLGLDPGYRTGVKVCVVDATGKFSDHAVIYPHAPRNDWKGSVAALAALCKKHDVDLVAIGNGTASRETEKLADDVISAVTRPGMSKIVVSEAGASVYSASEIAEREFPNLDVTIRGAISIARRLQDPLAELVKIDPKAIGVGQYQHDVSQTALARSLDATVEDCVNQVGVDLDTASAALLARVAGLTPTLAENIVSWRDEHGSFPNRKALKKVPRLGEKAFEQAAGFLRIANGSDPLDASGVHPESYPVVQRIVDKADKPLAGIIGDMAWLRSLDPADYTDERFGLPTVKDIIAELEKPGRDPRPEFRTVRFTDGVEKIGDLVEDQVLEGQVTNVTAFGAFVDVGVHQDGLVHISALSDTFVKDPRDVVKAGDIVRVKVMSVDVPRNRIGLTMRLTDSSRDNDQTSRRKPTDRKPGNHSRDNASRKARSTGKPAQADAPSALAQSLKAALTEKNN